MLGRQLWVGDKSEGSFSDLVDRLLDLSERLLLLFDLIFNFVLDSLDFPFLPPLLVSSAASFVFAFFVDGARDIAPRDLFGFDHWSVEEI